MEFRYVGNELELFRHATNWKSYLARHVIPFLGSDVLEVGAGFGATTEALQNDKARLWVCLEPDPSLAGLIHRRILDKELPEYCKAMTGGVDLLAESELFDSILYIDVLEHIDDGSQELRISARHLKPGGHLIILSPAHQALFSPFDKAVGHHRRYNKRSLREEIPAGMTEKKLAYLDSVGALASLANKLALRQHEPSLRQILFWDRRLIPLSRLVDRLSFNHVGKSILGIWTKN